MSEERIKQVHFIGVGGVGMSGIARVAHDPVSYTHLTTWRSRAFWRIRQAR